MSKLRVKDLTSYQAILGSMVISEPDTPPNHILYVSKSHRGRREQNDDGSWPDPITSPDEFENGKNQLLGGVHISYYIIEDEPEVVREVLKEPKDNIVFPEPDDPNISESDVNVVKQPEAPNFMYWDVFAREYADSEIISDPEKLNDKHVK